MTERRWVDVEDFATDCERETMEMNQNQRSHGECRSGIGQSRAMGNGYAMRIAHEPAWQ